MRINEARRELKQLREQEIQDLERHEKAGTCFDQADRENDEKRSTQILALAEEVQNLEQIQKRAQKAREENDRDERGEKSGRREVPEADKRDPFSAGEGRELLRGWLARDITFDEFQRRGQSVGIFTEGGALVTPVVMRQAIATKIDDEVVIRGLANVETVVGAESLGIPTMEDDISDPDWTSELAAPSETQVAFGGRELTPRRLVKLVKISREMIRRRPDIQAFVTQRIARKYAKALENNYINGNGIKRPLGVLENASGVGISTARDTATGAAITADKMYDFEASLKAGYRRNANFMTHRLHWNDFRKLKDTTGRYLLDINTIPNSLATSLFLGRPLYLSEFFPSTKATGDYAMVYGDWSYYSIVDADGLTIEVMKELFRLNNQIGLISEMYSDGMPIIEEAFSRLRFS